MGIVTKKGDRGNTTLMYNRAVSKSHPRVEACGSIDELTSALGLARANIDQPRVAEPLLGIQKDLIVVMGELATLPEDRERYRKDGYSIVTPEMTGRLEQLVQGFEIEIKGARDWALPGSSLASASLDLARSIARRAERQVCGLSETNQLPNPEIIVYLNRLSDLIWLMARWLEVQQLPSQERPKLA